MKVIRQVQPVNAGIEKSIFGRLPDGTEIEQYTLTNGNGLSCKIITYGGTITELRAPDRNGKFANIVLGYDRLEDYLAGKDYRGAIIGRVANRIAGASFTLDGKTYPLAANDGPNHLHGGLRGFDKRVWQAQPVATGPDAALSLTYTSPDGEEGYPGTVRVRAVYAWTATNALHFQCVVQTDEPTPVNLTTHPYWNLACGGDILRHELAMAADRYTPMNSQHVPTGKIEAVAGTHFDFRTPRALGSRFNQIVDKPPGYNANYVLNPEARGKQAKFPAARARDPESGRVLEIRTDQPGLQFYSGTFLAQPYAGFCLEAQNFPDAMHHPSFPNCILSPEETYFHTTICRFSAD